MNIRLTPQQKKKLSYKKDRRNTYGERGAHSRHAIRDSKNIIERKRRHSENQELRAITTIEDEEQIIAIENSIKSLSTAKMKFQKVADTPLGEVIAAKLACRKFKGMTTHSDKLEHKSYNSNPNTVASYFSPSNFKKPIAKASFHIKWQDILEGYLGNHRTGGDLWLEHAPTKIRVVGYLKVGQQATNKQIKEARNKVNGELFEQLNILVANHLMIPGR